MGEIVLLVLMCGLIVAAARESNMSTVIWPAVTVAWWFVFSWIPLFSILIAGVLTIATMTVTRLVQNKNG